MSFNMEDERKESSRGMTAGGSAGDPEALASDEVEAAEYLSKWRRAEQDFARYQRFAEQQKKEAKFANKTLMLNLLTVLDDLERAFKFIPDEELHSQWVGQIRRLHGGLWAALEGHGLSEIAALGQAFDPAVHEAVAMAPGEEGEVVEEVRKGYKWHDRVLRPANVIVGNGKPVCPASDVVRR